MDRQPMNVMAYQKIPNLVESMASGIKMAGELVKMPREAQQTATEAMLSAAAKESLKSIQARVKAVQADKTLTQDQKNEKIGQIYLQSGVGYSGGHPDWQPYAGASRFQGLQQGEQGMQERELANPALQKHQPVIQTTPTTPAPVKQPTPVQPAPGKEPTTPADKDLMNQLGMIDTQPETGLMAASFLQQPNLEYQNQMGGGLMRAPLGNYAYA
jgi:hypothetical protein